VRSHSTRTSREVSTVGAHLSHAVIPNFVGWNLYGLNSFNVGVFGAGGKATLLGESWDADERPDQLAFALLADHARYSQTLFDLRPLRRLLHQIPEPRSALQENLLYWADSYDALICFKQVTPRTD
jgi:erythromycin esterase-like protein